MSIRTLETEDKLEYQFIPVFGNQIQFRVKATHDAHVALTPGPDEGEPMYEVFFGGWENNKSVIRKNRTKPEVAEVLTPGILNNDEFRGFWIRWYGNTLTAGKEGEQEPMLTYTDPDQIVVGYIGVCTGWGASGVWQLEGYDEVVTRNDLKYHFHSIPGCVIIQVKTKSNAHVALVKNNVQECSPMYEIMLGGWENTASAIRYDRKQPDKVRKDTPNLLHPHEYKQFAISWRNGHIVTRVGDQNGPVLMEWTDPNPFGINYIGVRTGWGSTGKWNIKFDHLFVPMGTTDVPRPSAPSIVGSTAIWCESVAGIIPSGAVEGGRDLDGPLYVGRAQHEGALIPGKVNPQHAVCYIPWGGAEHGKSQYEVLCGCPSNWVPTSGDNIPPNAIPAGQSEDGEVLYIGRANHEGTVTIGKVQPSHKVLYIPFGGQEVPFPEYEILVA